MPRSHILMLLLFALCLAGCARQKPTDPVALSETSSEEIWYKDGGARWAWTAVDRPRQLYTGYGTVRDPALAQGEPVQPVKKRVIKRAAKPKAPVQPVRSPDCPPCPACPPCPPADAAKPAVPNSGAGRVAPTPAPQSPALSPAVPPQAAPPPTPSAFSGSFPPLAPPSAPLPAMPPATPAPAALPGV